MQTTRQAGKFGLVGVASTLIDFILLNLGHNVIGLGLIEANLISTTVAMVMSFSLNRRYVFGTHESSIWRQGVAFVAVTAFGVYVIQNLVIHFLATTWIEPVHLIISLVGAVGLGKVLSNEVIVTNFTKLVATVFSLIWNFIWYKKVVFI